MEKPIQFSRNEKKPFLDGIFYPSDPQAVKTLLDKKLEAFDQKKIMPADETAAGIILPHGAWDFTAEYVLYTFLLVKQLKPDFCIFLAPFHDDYSGRIYLPEYTVFRYPDGKCEIDRRHYPESSRSEIVRSNIPFDEETSFEPILPVAGYLGCRTPLLPVFCSADTKTDVLSGFFESFASAGARPFYIFSLNTVSDSKNLFCCQSLQSAIYNMPGCKLNIADYPKIQDNTEKSFNIRHQLFIIKKD